MSKAKIKEIYTEYIVSKKESSQAEAPVPLSQKIPFIDGKLSVGEWDDATVLPLARMNGDGIFNCDLAGTVYLKHDTQNLYVGFHTPATKIMEKGKAGEMDSKLFNGSEFEIWWRQPEKRKTEYSQLGIAPNNAWAFRNSQGKWTSLQFQHRAISDSEGWGAELAIPFASLEAEPGKVLDFQFCMHRPEYPDFYNQWIVWNVKKTKVPLFMNMGKLHFRNDRFFVKLNGIGNINYGDFSLELSSAKALDYRVTNTVKGLSSSKGTTKHPIKLSGKALPSSGEIRIELKDGQKTVFIMKPK